MTKTTGKAWPWKDESVREKYYEAIVGKPFDKAARYSHLVDAIRKELSWRKEPDGCYGAAYDVDDDMCIKRCPQMPACRVLCKKHPDWVESFARQAPEPVEEPEPPREQKYKWIGDVSTYDGDDTDEDTRWAVRKLAERKRFTRKFVFAVVKRFAAEPDEFVDVLISYLLEVGDAREV